MSNQHRMRSASSLSRGVIHAQAFLQALDFSTTNVSDTEAPTAVPDGRRLRERCDAVPLGILEQEIEHLPN